MDPDGLTQAAAYMPLFPLIGAVIGFVAGICVWLLELILPQLVAATIGVGVLFLINGVQHLDGLLDFGDGLMFHGSKAGKLRVMRYPTTGAGGLALGLVVLLTAVFSISAIPQHVVISTLVAAESSGAFAMVLGAAVGKAAHKGMSTVFIEAMHRKASLRVGLAYIIVVAISFFALQYAGIVTVVGSTVTALAIVLVARRNFGGVTGDVFGAMNEIARVISLLSVLVIMKWV